MLYDPKWKRENVADLVAWLETKPADGAYNFRCPQGCLIAQWMDGVSRMAWSEDVLQMFGGQDPHRIAAGPIGAGAQDWTYGAALARARGALVA